MVNRIIYFAFNDARIPCRLAGLYKINKEGGKSTNEYGSK